MHATAARRLIATPLSFSDGQKLTKKLLTKSLTKFFSWINSLTKNN